MRSCHGSLSDRGLHPCSYYASNLPFTEFEEFLQRTEQPLTEAQRSDPDLLAQLKGAGYEIKGGKAVREEFLVHRIKTAILNGLRPIMPTTSPPFLQTLVRLCWNAMAAERPSFVEIVDLLSTRLGVADDDTPSQSRRRSASADASAPSPRTAGVDSKLAEALTIDTMDVVIRRGEGQMVHETLMAALKAAKGAPSNTAATPLTPAEEEREEVHNEASDVLKTGKSRDLRVPHSDETKRKSHRSKSSRGGTSGSSSKRNSGVPSDTQ